MVPWWTWKPTAGSIGPVKTLRDSSLPITNSTFSAAWAIGSAWGPVDDVESLAARPRFATIAIACATRGWSR